MKSLQRKLGKKIRSGREDLGMTQRRLAERLGVSQSTVSHLELGKHSTVNMERLFRVCRIVGLNPLIVVFACGIASPREVSDILRRNADYAAESNVVQFLRKPTQQVVKTPRGMAMRGHG